MLSPQRLQQRSDLLQAVRTFFLSRSYIEVDTPIRQPVLIPEAEIRPVPAGEWFLQTSPELCMKRLLASGCTQIFQICHCFRQGETGRLHQEEFTMLEWYHTGWDYHDLMDECEQLIGAVGQCLTTATVQNVMPTLTLSDKSAWQNHNRQPQKAMKVGPRGMASSQVLRFSDKKISLTPPWQRLSVEEAFQKFCGTSAQQAVEQGRFDELLVERVEPHLGWDSPLFLYDYPVALASLAQQKKTDPAVAERFELYIGGIELANGFTELIDRDVQRQRFYAELEKQQMHGLSHLLPEKFLQDLVDVPECAGIALGLDRLLMVCVGATTLAEVLPFTAHDL